MIYIYYLLISLFFILTDMHLFVFNYARNVLIYITLYYNYIYEYSLFIVCIFARNNVIMFILLHNNIRYIYRMFIYCNTLCNTKI